MLTGRTVTVTAGPGAPYDGVFLEFVPGSPPAYVVATIESSGGVVNAVGIIDFIFTDAPPVVPDPPGAHDIVQFQIIVGDTHSILMVLLENGEIWWKIKTGWTNPDETTDWILLEDPYL